MIFIYVSVGKNKTTPRAVLWSIRVPISKLLRFEIFAKVLKNVNQKYY